MSFKTIFLLVVILLCGTFIFLKVLVLGDPASTFNQTTRVELGKYPLARFILGLRDYGDARAEYFYGKGPIEIKWYRPQLQEVDPAVMTDFAEIVSKYTDRPARAAYGGVIDDGTIDKHSGLRSTKLFGAEFDKTTLYVFFTNEYKPRGETELATTYEESGILVSLRSHQDFLRAFPERTNRYLLSSLLHEFGHQLGLEHNENPSCVMIATAGEGGQPLQIASGYTPSDFCAEEAEEIKLMQLKLAK